MQKYFNTVASTLNGKPVSGVSVLVKTYPGLVLANIYTTNVVGTPIAGSTVTTDTNGYYEFYAPDGRYQLTFSGAGITTEVINDVLIEDPVDAGSILNGSDLQINGISLQGTTGAGLVGATATTNNAGATVQAQLTNIGGATGAANVGFTQSGTGAVARTVQTELREAVKVTQFGADPTGVADSTTAFTNANAVSKNLHLPAGTYLLTNWRPLGGTRFTTDGMGVTFIKQGATGSPAINVLSDVTSGQLTRLDISGFTVIGATSATVEAVQVSATTPYIVSDSNFDYDAQSTYAPLKITDTSANEVYANKFKINSNGQTYQTTTMGVYNEFDFFQVNCTGAVAVYDTSISSTFNRCVVDGVLYFAGQNCTFVSPRVEAISYSGTVYAPMEFAGYDCVVIKPVVDNVPNAKVTGCTFHVLNGHTIIEPRVWGTNYPSYPFIFGGTTSKVTIIGGDILSAFKIEQYVTASVMAQLTLLGDVSTFALTPTGGKMVRNVQTGATYTIDSALSTQGIDKLVVFNTAATCTVTLPSGATYTGRAIRLQNIAAFAINSASANVVPISGGAAGTAILAATAGKWVEMQYDGTNWNIMAGN